MSCMKDKIAFTERIYDTDSYCREFEATVISCQKNADLYDVILDKTAFSLKAEDRHPTEGESEKQKFLMFRFRMRL